MNPDVLVALAIVCLALGMVGLLYLLHDRGPRG